MVDSSQMSEERFKALVETYGGDPAHWPAKEREAGERLLGSNMAARAAAADAARLDQILSAASGVSASGELEAKLMADFERVARRRSPLKVVTAMADAVWPGAPLWQPACAFGLALVIGVGVAWLAPLDVGQADETVGVSFALDSLPDTDVGQDI